MTHVAINDANEYYRGEPDTSTDPKRDSILERISKMECTHLVASGGVVAPLGEVMTDVHSSVNESGLFYLFINEMIAERSANCQIHPINRDYLY